MDDPYNKIQFTDRMKSRFFLNKSISSCAKVDNFKNRITIKHRVLQGLTKYSKRIFCRTSYTCRQGIPKARTSEF